MLPPTKPPSHHKPGPHSVLMERWGARRKPVKEGVEEGEDGEKGEDYMTMSLTSFLLPQSQQESSSLHRRIRQKRQGELRARTKSKADMLAEEKQRREDILGKSLFERAREQQHQPGFGGSGRAGGGSPGPGSKGLRIMQKMGFVVPWSETEKGKKSKNEKDEDEDEDEDAKDEGSGKNSRGERRGEKEKEEKEGEREDVGTVQEPLHIQVKWDRRGIGHDAEERKRKFEPSAAHGFPSCESGVGQEMQKRARHTASTAAAAAAVDGEEDYRERVRRDRDEARWEKQFRAARKVAEGLWEREQESGKSTARNINITAAATHQKPQEHAGRRSPPPLAIRSLMRDRARGEHARAAEKHFLTSLSLLPSCSPPSSPWLPSTSKLPRMPTWLHNPTEEEEDSDYKVAMGIHASPDHGHLSKYEVVDDKGEDQGGGAGEEQGHDGDLDEFDVLPPRERLARTLTWLREEYRYCFWCKFRYEGGEMEGCPGLTEEEHD